MATGKDYGPDLWDLCWLTPQPGVGAKGECIEMVVDVENKVPLLKNWYNGSVTPPDKVERGHAAVAWAEGGSV